ncbi:MAG TPA: adenylyl-sulfate kinase [Pirellulaceae bacterium]|nr:adenylyl-sulfate kinase [Pirellulaceae bacterium]HMO91650.1 adenylyl-sulfate kinase [Pirellulaceae bacterium]HMP68347.1 adenylyl-sulfate kinase [Pirellulaceae bacterium]
MNEKTRVTWHEPLVVRKRGIVVWFTGLSGSGKSTLANTVDQLLYEQNVLSYVLDGDNVRHGLNASQEILEPIYGREFAQRFGLGFSAMDREENVRRIGCVAEILCSAGFVVLTAFVSPYRRDRDLVRAHITQRGCATDFVEVFVNTSLDICEARDPKGLYKLARSGKLSGMTGIDAPYEPPLNPELTIDGDSAKPHDLARDIVERLFEMGRLKRV